MRAVMVSLAVCAVSTLLVGIVVADAVYAPRPAQAEPAASGWTTIVFKNPH